ncbi:MAG: RluA family pseudouridine synthase [Burkholderiaceae bacterium]|nr:RluA family pseudouridine synthase [Burkholderiaceae bacterium]
MNTPAPPSTGGRRPQPPVPLPTKNGVGPSCVALTPGPWATISAFLIERFPAVSAATWRTRMQQGELVDEHGVAVTPDRPYRSGGRLYYYRSIADEPRVPFDEVVLFQDELLVVADKPHFLPVTPGGKHLQETLLVRLKRRLGITTLAPLHRLDRETAGVVVFAVQPDTRGAYQALFAQRQVTKHYEAIAPWRPELTFPLTHRSRLVQDDHFLRMQEVPGEPNAETLFEVLDVQGDFARYRLTPLTGRTHQLRVHCAALGLPIVGDRMYPTLLPADTDDHEQPLQLLARTIAFVDPISGAARNFDSARELVTMNAAASF